MFELNGKYGSAKVFATLIDEASVGQIIEMLNQPFSEGQRIRMMPDVHAGAGCVIGTTMTVTDKICPNLVGVDIGCGMLAVMLKERSVDFNLLDIVIRQHVPRGLNVQEDGNYSHGVIDLNELKCVNSCNVEHAMSLIGTLGGGNHFIEVDRDSDDRLWLVIHSGSRNLGIRVAGFYQKEAVKLMRSVDEKVPDELCWLDGNLFDDYVHDMKIVQKFAAVNRQAIADTIMYYMDLHQADKFESVHNYLDTERMILRKGAVSAEKDSRILIPMNMRDGSLICVGKGNEDWNSSAPHGAGRLLSRSAAKDTLSMDEFKASMRDVWTTSVNQSTIDESPMAYKPMDSIVSNIGDTVDIVDVIKPLYNFKAGE